MRQDLTENGFHVLSQHSEVPVCTVGHGQRFCHVMLYFAVLSGEPCAVSLQMAALCMWAALSPFAICICTMSIKHKSALSIFYMQQRIVLPANNDNPWSKGVFVRTYWSQRPIYPSTVIFLYIFFSSYFLFVCALCCIVLQKYN